MKPHTKCKDKYKMSINGRRDDIVMEVKNIKLLPIFFWIFMVNSKTNLQIKEPLRANPLATY